jgi:hypothetical protein
LIKVSKQHEPSGLDHQLHLKIALQNHPFEANASKQTSTDKIKAVLSELGKWIAQGMIRQRGIRAITPPISWSADVLSEEIPQP